MTMSPLKENKETSSLKADFLLNVADMRWVGILSESAINILWIFHRKHMRGEALLGKYSEISYETTLSKGSISKGLDELEAFGFIKNVRKCGKTKVYELGNNIMPLNDDWRKFFKVKEYKEFCIDALLNKDIDNKIIDKLNLKFNNSNDEFIKKTLGRVLYFFFEKKGFTIEDLLEEEYLKMKEEFLFQDGFGFSLGTEDCDDWTSILTDEEKNHKELMKIFTHYADKVAYPNRKDIDLMKKAYTFCFPYQIIMGIDSILRHPNRKDKFKSFAYIYKEVKSGRFGGTRAKNTLKTNIEELNAKRKPINNQTDRGHKNSSLDRTEIIDKMSSLEVDNIEDILNGKFDVENDSLDFNEFI